ncbi:MAG: hypothetical protein CML21_00420 [Rheinheimera sp.]|nr:hypothetical protein [Rheinheimera sp.]
MIALKHLLSVAMGTALLISLNGCGKKPEVVPEKTLVTRPALKQLPSALIPNGHWLVNPLHCSKQLPSQGVFDFKVNGHEIVTFGIEQKGKWHQFDDEAVKAQANRFLSSDKASCLTFPTDNLIYASFSAPGTEYTLIYASGSDKLLLIDGQNTHLASKFDIEAFRTYEFVELEQPDDVDVADQPVTNTNSLIEVIHEQG